MKVKKKSSEDIKNQVKGFLEHEEEIGNITEDKKNKILEVLLDKDINLSHKEQIKKQLLGVLNTDEFEGLYGEYIKYYKDSSIILREWFEKINLLPAKYSFLINKFIDILLQSDSLESLQKEIQEMSDDDIDEWKNGILSIITFFENLSFDKNDIGRLNTGFFFMDDTDGLKKVIDQLEVLGIKGVDNYNKLIGIITYYNPDKVIKNMITLKDELGINGAEGFSKLKDIITHYDSDRVIKNMITLKNELGIDEAEDFSELKDIIESNNIDHKISIMKKLINLGIEGVDNFSKLQDLIVKGESGKIEANMSTLRGLGIEGVDNFSKLQDLIVKGESGKIESNISTLRGLGVEGVDNFSKLQDLIVKGESDNIEANISTLRGLGIEGVDNFSKLADLIMKGESGKIEANISTLRGLGIEGVDNFSKLADLIMKGESGKIEANIRTLRGLGIEGVDNFSKLADLIMKGESGKIEVNISTLRGLGIEGVDNFNLLKDLIIKLDNDKVKSFILIMKKSGIDILESFWKIREFFIYGKIENIEMLDKLGVKFNFDGIQKMNIRNIITDGKVGNIEALDILGLEGVDIDEISKLYYIITRGDPRNVKQNIIALKELFGIDINLSNITDFNIPITEGLPENIKALKDLGIEITLDNLIDQINIIRETGANVVIEVLNKLGIISSFEDLTKMFYNLKGFCINNPDKAKCMSNLIKDLGVVNSVSDFENHYNMINIFCAGKCENVEFLSGMKVINSIDDLANLDNIIINGKIENIDKIKDLGIEINSIDDLLSLSNIILNGKIENIDKIMNLGIKIDTAYDLGSLRNIILWGKKENIEAIKDLGIELNSIADLQALEAIITNGKKENIEAIRDLGIEIKSSIDRNRLGYIIHGGKKENIEVIRDLGIEINTVDDLLGFEDIITNGKKENIDAIKDLGIEINTVDDLQALGVIIANGKKENIDAIKDLGIEINTVDDLLNLDNIIINGKIENISILLDEGFLVKNGKYNTHRLLKLGKIICCGNPIILKTVLLHKFKINEFDTYEDILCYDGFFPSNLEFKELDCKGYLKYIKEIINLHILDETTVHDLISDIVRLPFTDIDGYLEKFKEICINQNIAYSDFIKFFNGKTFNQNLCNFFSKGFEIPGSEINDNVGILNYSIKKIYPTLNIEFNESETKQILDFINSIGGINKGYTILILTMEKMIRDKVEKRDFNKKLCEKLEKYKKILDMYPEDKIPEGLKISVGIEFEMRQRYLDWYEMTTGNNYYDVVDNIVKNAKVGIEREGVYEYATKPSTNPIVSLLEIHLLQELNLLDINDMQKISCLFDKDNKQKDFYENPEIIKYKSKKGTGYHLNIGSDSDIGIDENVQFIQNLCTILPRSGLSNGANISGINPYSNVNSKSSNFSVFKGSESDKYIELRTYSVDNVELFEKNVLFNTYAIMGSQAEKKVTRRIFENKKILYELKNNVNISSSEALLDYFEKNNYFNGNQDLKSKKIAAEFMFMQVCVLRAISDYNNNFIDNEVFGKDLVQNLSETRKNCFFDILLSDKGETFGYGEEGYSTMVVKRYTNLNDNFNIEKYLSKEQPFSDEESGKILRDLGNNLDEKRIPYITTWLNKQLLRQFLCVGVSDTGDLQLKINNILFNVDRIKSYIKKTEGEKNGEGYSYDLKIDIQYLHNYFKSNMSLLQFNPYHSINTDFMNKIINLNNFFLKNDDTNANGVLKKTINNNGEEEKDITELSLFETGGKMRKGYNYYQGGSKDMLLHRTQTIALDYMENVKNILNTDYNSGKLNSKLPG